MAAVTQDPNGPDALWREIRKLREDLNTLAAAVRAGFTTIDRGGLKISAPEGLSVENGGSAIVRGGGGVVVQDDGAIRAQSPTGVDRFYTGKTTTGVPVTMAKRDDGTIAFVVYGSAGTQYVALMDRAGNIVCSDDTASGQGVATPYIPVPAYSLSVPTDTTVSATFTALQALLFYKQQPRILVQVLGRCSDAGTTGEVRLVDGSTVLAGPVALPAGAFGYYTLGPVPIAGAHFASKGLNIEARRTAGTGTVGVRVAFATGLQSP